MRLPGRSPDPVMVFLRRLRWPIQNRRPIWPSIGRGAIAGAIGACLVALLEILGGDNLHTVQPGRSYRAAQMSSKRLEAVIRERGICTVVNLRGYCPDFDWYRDECRATQEADAALEDVTLSAIRLPAPSEIRRLVEVLDHAEYPILMHCRQGVDRTGLACAIVKLLEPGVSLATAERQLSLAHGYVPYNGTEHMRQFLSLYRDWLDRLGVQHSPELFRHWAMREYCPGACRASVELLDWPAEFAAWPPSQGRAVHIRVWNRSIRNWRFLPGTDQGIHARYTVADENGRVVISERAGMVDAVVPPNESIDLELGVPALAPGRYVLTIDLIDVEQNAFSQFGMEPTVREFRVATN